MPALHAHRFSYLIKICKGHGTPMLALMYMEIQIHTLGNGIRIAHKYVPHTQISHCGFVLNIGSRDEQAHQQGIAHFWEHMAFKGTHKRKAFHILNRLEAVGGELNAQTTKEKISFYASLLTKHYEKAVELLADITFDSIFPENQIERERKVILEEMAMYQDAPDEALGDEFDALIFGNHPLGANILGTSDTVAALRREDFNTFVKDNLNTHQIIFASVGNLSFEQVCRLAEKYLAHIPETRPTLVRQPFECYTPRQVLKTHRASQSYCAIGRVAYPLQHPRQLVLHMLNNLLGGPSMNSRLNLVLRERHGYVYSVDSAFIPFTDTGLWGIYFATEPSQLERSIQLVLRELRTLRQQKLGIQQLQQAKEQLCGQLAMTEESNLGFMQMMGNALLDLGYIEPLSEIFKAIHQVRAEDLQEVANELFQESDLSILRYVPQDL